MLPVPSGQEQVQGMGVGGAPAYQQAANYPGQPAQQPLPGYQGGHQQQQQQPGYPNLSQPPPAYLGYTAAVYPTAGTLMEMGGYFFFLNIDPCLVYEIKNSDSISRQGMQ